MQIEDRNRKEIRISLDPDLSFISRLNLWISGKTCYFPPWLGTIPKELVSAGDEFSVNIDLNAGLQRE